MLSYAISFFVVALLAGFFGFWGVAGLATEIAKGFALLLALNPFRDDLEPDRVRDA